jgi:hypothetical protein
MRKRKFDFRQAIVKQLQVIGAREAGPYGWQIDTLGGLLDIKPYDDWVACRFDDVERATANVRFGSLNHYSGKWNWHFLNQAADDVDYFIGQLTNIQLIPRELA